MKINKVNLYLTQAIFVLFGNVYSEVEASISKADGFTNKRGNCCGTRSSPHAANLGKLWSFRGSC